MLLSTNLLSLLQSVMMVWHLEAMMVMIVSFMTRQLIPVFTPVASRSLIGEWICNRGIADIISQIKCMSNVSSPSLDTEHCIQSLRDEIILKLPKNSILKTCKATTPGKSG